jgi:hypothetical protein
VFELASKKIRLELIGHPGGIIERLAYAHDAGFLASGASDTTAVVWRAGLRAFVTDKSANAPTASAQQLDERFTQMAGASATAAFQSMIHLVQTPAQTVKLLESKIHAAKQPDPGEKTIAQWILDLGNGKYAVRTKASDVLKKLGPAVTPDLQAALIKAPDIETKRRIEELLERFASHDWTADEILHSRAVELADAIATPDARALLTRWSTGDAGAILTRESRKALASRGP